MKSKKIRQIEKLDLPIDERVELLLVGEGVKPLATIEVNASFDLKKKVLFLDGKKLTYITRNLENLGFCHGNSGRGFLPFTIPDMLLK